MKKSNEKVSQNGTKTSEQLSNPQNGSDSKAYSSAMKAFTTTNKRLHPELYKGNKKVGKIRG